MPELPEVETTRRGIAPHIEGQRVSRILVRQPRLRWPIPETVLERLPPAQLHRVRRRAKYLLLEFETGHLLMHLGMSGSLHIVDPQHDAGKHDHLDLVFDNGQALRLTDPRRFGAVLWLGADPLEHPLLARLGPEPFSNEFAGSYLYRLSRGRKLPVKQFIMNQHIVTGVGNIYASEALFHSGIRPTRPAGKISAVRYQHLADAIKEVLAQAIAQGGTTLRDFVGGDGKPGYFQQQLHVYGRTGLPCSRCGHPLQETRLGNRSSVYCSHCQR